MDPRALAALMALGLVSPQAVRAPAPPPWIAHERWPQEGTITTYDLSSIDRRRYPRRPSEMQYYFDHDVDTGAKTKHRKVGRRP